MTVEACWECGVGLANGPEPGFERNLCQECAIRQRIADEERLDTRECSNCHRSTRYWGRAVWRRDGREYCKACVKALERVWFIANSCIDCNRLIGRHERKVTPPELVQRADPYVRNLVVKERKMCWDCYEAMTKRPFGARVGRVTEAKRGTQIPLGFLRMLGMNR